MKKIILILCFISISAHATIKAVTNEGEIVLLNSNGTWEYESTNKIKSAEIPLNTANFKKPPSSIFNLKSKRTNSQVWLDPQKWGFKKAVSNEEAEYQFLLKNQDLYGMLITEQVEINLELLAQLAFENAKTHAPNMKIVKQEFRVVNGNKVIYMEMQGTMRGIEFTYLGYYFSNKSGSTQLVTYTATNLTEKYYNDIQEFLNGLSAE